jgi:hypothetical protein
MARFLAHPCPRRSTEVKTLQRLIARMPGRLLALVCLALALIPPSVAYAASITYAQSTNGSGGYWHSGYNSYLYNQVWHSGNAAWEVYYAQSNGSVVGDVANYNNPTQWPYSISYADSWCHNINDNTGVVWTCQYGK